MDAPMPSKLQLLAVPLVLSILLFAVSSAHAMPTGPIIAAFTSDEPLEDEFEEEGEGEEETGCETAEEEVEEGELSQREADEICEEEAKESKKAAGSNAQAPEECVLRSAHAHAAVAAAGEKLKLTIGYTTYEPITAKLQIGHLTTLHRHLGRSGVIRIVEGLNGENVPKQLNVRIDIPSVKRAGCPSRRLVLFPR
jgi:hypothetical protein